MASKYPKSVGGGWFELSDGNKVQGEEDALAAQKKLTTKKIKQKAQPKPPSGPSYEELLQARRAMNDAHARVLTAERAVRSARTINTFAERDVAVTRAHENLAQARIEAADATERFTTLKYERKANG